MTATMPGYAHFVWLLFIQPITLHERLKACEVDEPGISSWKWWQQRRQLHENYRAYALRLLVVLLLPVAVFLLLALVSSVFHLGLPLSELAANLAKGAAVGAAFAVAGAAAGTATGATSGAIAGVIAGGDMFGAAGGAAGGATFGLVGCVGVAMASGGLHRRTRVVAMGDLALGVVLSMIGGMASGLVFGVVGGVVAGVVAGVCFMGTFLQLHLYILAVPIQFLLQLSKQNNPNRTLAFSPILFHNPIFFPLPHLTTHIITAASHDPTIAQRAIKAAQHSPGVRPAANRALAKLTASELGTLLHTQNFSAIHTMQGFWLPGPETTNPLLRTQSEAARFMLAAKDSASPYIALQHLDEVQTRLQALEKQLLTSGDYLAPHLSTLLNQWQQILSTTRQATESQAANVLPNPFIAGNPLSPEMRWGRDVFRGREAIIDEIELLLADRNNSASLALIGPRRCGKSSLIKMLPILLPDTVVVEFSLLGHPTDTPAAFYQALAQAAQTQAMHQRRVRLPALPTASDATPIEVLKKWFQQLENFTEATRILICIDEFERIETLFPDHGRQLQQFMGLLRATIQDCRRLRLLVAGTASFDDLGKIWNDNFINLRELRVGHLSVPAAEGLLQAPIPGVPFDAIPPPVAQAIFQRTQGQPFLTQAFAYVLVNQLNQAKRKVAELDDIDAVEEKVLFDFKYYFKNAWEETPQKQQAILLALAQQQGNATKIDLSSDKDSRRWLRRRLMINENDQILVPTFARWLREWEDRE